MRILMTRLFLGIVALLILSSLAEAQTGKASLNGTVTDSSGAEVAGAKIVAISTETGDKRETTSAGNGTYTFSLLPVGEYSVSCSHDGFKRTETPAVKLDVDTKATVNCLLQVGSFTEVVEVSASAAQVNTTNGEIGQLVPETVVEDLPLNGRNPGDLVNLAAGAVNGRTIGTGVFYSGDFGDFPNITGASINGSRQGQVYYQLDGANNMDYNRGEANPFPNPDATQEFRVVTNNFDVQGGFASGGLVDIKTRSGTNAWHGDAFEFLRNDALNATDYFAQTKDTLKRNQFGMSIGGPIRKDKLFIFGNYQGTTEHRVTNGVQFHVPNNKQLAIANANYADFSDLLTRTTTNACGAGGPSNLNYDTGQIFDPRTASFFTCPAGSANAGQQIVIKQPYSGNLIPASQLSPIALNIVNSTLPRTNSPIDLISLNGGITQQTYNEFTIHSDYNASDKNHISGKVFYNRFSLPPEDGGGDNLLSQRSWIAVYKNYSADWTYTIRPNLLNYFVFGYNNLATFSEPGLQKTKSGQPICFSCFGAKVAEPTPNPFPPGIEGLFVNGMDWNAQNSNEAPRHDYSVNETLTWTHGKHLIVAGANVLREYYSVQNDWLSLPLVSFDGRFTGNGVADFLLGDAAGFEQGAGERPMISGTLWGAFGQDTIRVKPTLTIGIGVRWEPFYSYKELSLETPAFRPGQHSSRYPNAPTDLVFAGDPAAGPTGVPNDIWVFDPRISIAWQPKALRNTSVRAAFGMFASPFEPIYYAHGVDTQPFAPTFNFDATTTGGPTVPGGTIIPLADPWSVYAPTGGTSPFPPFAPVRPGSTAQFITPVFVQTSFAGDLKQGRNQSWNLSIQHQFPSNILATVAYIGSEAYHLPVPWELNPGMAKLSGARANGNVDSVTSVQSWGTASYNGLQLIFDKRFSNGLQFTTNYAWSKGIDLSTEGNPVFFGGLTNPFNLRYNRGIADNNFPQIFNAYGIYRMPTLSSYGRWFSRIFGSWELSGVWHMQSGDPLTIFCGCDNSEAHTGGQRADLTGEPFNVGLGPNQGTVATGLSRPYISPAAFQSPTVPGAFGDSGKNILRGPGYNNLDFSFVKNVPFHERYRVQFRWEMFNALNHPEFGDPDTNVGDGPTAFGHVFSTKGCCGWEQQYVGIGPRVMQAALKFYW